MANNIELQDPFGYEKIEKYLKGLMDKNEEKTFLQELEKNPELKERAIAMARLAKGVQAAGVKNDEDTIDAFRSSDIDSIKKIADKVSNAKFNTITSNESKVISINNRHHLSWIAAAACFACIFFVGYQYNSYYQTASLGDEYASSFDVEYNIARGDESKVEIELQELKQNISVGQDLENTIHRLEILWELSLMDTYNEYTDLSPDLGWNLAIAHLKNNERTEAMIVLKKMKSLYQEDSAMGKQVRQLIDRIEKL